MSLTIPEMHLLIDKLQAELNAAEAAGEASRAAELSLALQDMKVLRAQALVAQGNAVAAGLADSTAAVEAIIARLSDPATLLALRPIAKETGIALPGNGSVTDTAPLVETVPVEPPVPDLDTSGPAPVGSPSRFVVARKTAPRTILFTDSEGRDFVRIGGSRSWRNFNPGNIRKGDFSRNMGAIGDDDSFAIFPDRAAGRSAIEALLRGPSYSPLTLEQAINRYAPPSENDTRGYVDFVATQTGLSRSRKLEEMVVAEIRKIVAAIETMEGWIAGDERAHVPTSGQATAALAAGNAGGVSSAIGAAAEWMDIARAEASLPAPERSEISGPASNPRILKYFRVAAAWFEPGGDETDWCAAFVNYCLETSGYVGTNHPGARSFFWNKKNQFIRLDRPRIGTVAVRRYAPFDDARWEAGKGHVGFLVDYTESHVTLLGGNQGNSITQKTFPRKVTGSDGRVTSEFVAFMMPVMN